MATFVGHLLDGAIGLAITPDGEIRQDFYDTAPETPSAVTAIDTTGPASGARTDQGYQRFPTNHTGYFIPSFAAIFYNRIVATPNPIQVGNLIADEIVTLSVWNGFFESRNLQTIATTGSEGITLTGPSPPTDYFPLQEITYNLLISASTGPPTISASYFFDFDGMDFDITVAVTGNRILPLPYLFQAGLLETLSWQTKVITSNDGSEQRMKLRGSPRQEFSFNLVIPRGDLTYLDSLLYAWRGNSFGVPVSSECRPLTAPTSPISPIIQVDTRYGDFRIGGLAMVYNNERDLELITIEDINQTSITATADLTKTYNAGTLVMPVAIARLVSSPSRDTSGYAGRLNARFVVTANTTLPSAASPLQYKGLDVFIDEQLTVGGFARDIYEQRVDAVDYSTGLVDTFTPWRKTKIQRTFGRQFDNLQDVWEHRLWLHRREGKLCPFWMPTMEADFSLVSTGPLTLDLLVVDDGQQFLMAEREDIAILTTTGWLFREITSVSKGEQHLLLGVDTLIGVEANDVVLLSFLGRKRLSSDRLEINWGGNNTGNTVVPVIELNN